MRTRTLRHLSTRPQLCELESRAVPTILQLNTLLLAGASFHGYEDYGNSGRSVAGAGDVNGDGFADMIIGTPTANNGRGAAHIIFGDPGLANSMMHLNNHGPGGLTLNGFEDGMQAGYSVAGAGDVNGDTFDDVIIGARLADMGGNNRGAAYIVYGRASYGGTALSLDNLADLGTTLRGFEDGMQGGFSVAGAGDINKDGKSDVIVGSPYRDAGGTDRGSAYVVYGDGLLPGFSLSLGSLGNWGFTLKGFENGARAGYSVAGAGDINGDENADVIVGSPNANVGSADCGVSYIVQGGGITPGSTLTLNNLGTRGVTLKGFDNDGLAGYSVAAAGDFDADGYSDVIIGAPAARGILPDTTPHSGAAYLVFGGTSLGGTTITLNSMPRGVTFRGFESGAVAGYSVAGAGDFDDDGYDDVIIGSPNSSTGSDYFDHFGEAYVVRGRHLLASTSSINLNNLGTKDRTLRGHWSEMLAGNSVAGAGDVNGDGKDDVLVGAPGWDVVGPDRGAAYLVFGARTLLPPAPMSLVATSTISPPKAERFRSPNLPPPPDSSDLLFLGGVDVDSHPEALNLGQLTTRSGVRPAEDLFPDDWLLIDR